MFVLGRSRSGSPAVPRCCDTHICIVPTSIAATVPHVLGWSAPSSTDRLIKVGHPCHPLSRRLVRDCALAGPKRDAVGVLKARGLACCGHGCWWWWGCSQQLLSTGMAARGLQRSPQASAASDVGLPSVTTQSPPSLASVWPQSYLVLGPVSAVSYLSLLMTCRSPSARCPLCAFNRASPCTTIPGTGRHCFPPCGHCS